MVSRKLWRKPGMIWNRERTTAKHGAKINLPGIWIHDRFIRVDFMRRGVRHLHALGLENLMHAARLRIAALHSRGNLAFSSLTRWVIPIARYPSGSSIGRWIESVSPSELERNREGMQSMVQIVPNLSQDNYLKYSKI